MVGFQNRIYLKIRECARTCQVMIKQLTNPFSNLTTVHLFVLVNFQLKCKFVTTASKLSYWTYLISENLSMAMKLCVPGGRNNEVYRFFKSSKWKIGLQGV